MSRQFIGIICLVAALWVPKTSLSEQVYTVGIVPQFDTRKVHRIWRPILDRLQAETGHKFVLRGSPTIPKFEKEFNAGEYDFAYMNPYHLLLASKSQGYIPLVHDVGRQLYGVLVIKKDSAIKTIKDLDGKIVAFPAPNSLGASLMIRADLKDNHDINIKPKYVKTHSSVYLNVLLDQVAAGGGVQKTLTQQPDNVKSNLSVLYKTKKVSPHPFVAHPRVDNLVREKVGAALLKLGESAKDRELLKHVPIKKIGYSTMSDFDSLSKMGLDKYYVAE